MQDINHLYESTKPEFPTIFLLLIVDYKSVLEEFCQVDLKYIYTSCSSYGTYSTYKRKVYSKIVDSTPTRCLCNYNNNNNKALVPKFLGLAMVPRQISQDQSHLLFSSILFYLKTEVIIFIISLIDMSFFFTSTNVIFCLPLPREVKLLCNLYSMFIDIYA